MILKICRIQHLFIYPFKYLKFEFITKFSYFETVKKPRDRGEEKYNEGLEALGFWYNIRRLNIFNIYTYIYIYIYIYMRPTN